MIGWMIDTGLPYHQIISHHQIASPSHISSTLKMTHLILIPEVNFILLNLLSGYPGRAAKNKAGWINSQFGAKHKLGGGRSFIKCPFYATSLSLAGLLWGAGCPQIGQLQGGKETQVLPGYLPLTDRVSLELLKKLEIEMTGKEMLPLTDAQCHLNFR